MRRYRPRTLYTLVFTVVYFPFFNNALSFSLKIVYRTPNDGSCRLHAVYLPLYPGTYYLVNSALLSLQLPHVLRVVRLADVRGEDAC